MDAPAPQPGTTRFDTEQVAAQLLNGERPKVIRAGNVLLEAALRATEGGRFIEFAAMLEQMTKLAPLLREQRPAPVPRGNVWNNPFRKGDRVRLSQESRAAGFGSRNPKNPTYIRRSDDVGTVAREPRRGSVCIDWDRGPKSDYCIADSLERAAESPTSAPLEERK